MFHTTSVIDGNHIKRGLFTTVPASQEVPSNPSKSVYGNLQFCFYYNLLVSSTVSNLQKVHIRATLLNTSHIFSFLINSLISSCIINNSLVHTGVSFPCLFLYSNAERHSSNSSNSNQELVQNDDHELSVCFWFRHIINVV